MPELPEVETVVRGLMAAGLPGVRIDKVNVRTPRTVEGMNARQFARLLSGKRIEGFRRRGKFIVMRVEGRHAVLIHLRMTGRLLVYDADVHGGPHDHVLLRLDDGRTVVFRDYRKFGRWRLTDDPEAELARLGPEPLARNFTSDAFSRCLDGRRSRVKSALLDQEVVAGLGNIYVDEALWESGLHPLRRCDSLTKEECKRLHAAIRCVLRRGIRYGGTTLGEAATHFRGAAGKMGGNQKRLMVFRRTGLPCPRCGSPILRLVVAQRGTHICGRCQS